jgi:threonine/homoserine/homoserine lactone efflux protein
MTPELLIALIAFAFVSAATPGPNNIMLMASGANFGFQRTVPHMLGVTLGFGFMVIMVGLGLVQLFDVWAQSYLVLKVVSVVYLLYFAWRIANATPPPAADEAGAAPGRPFTFLQAAAFQWVNPKAWAMALTAVAIYAPSKSVAAVLLVSAAFVAVTLPSVSAWTVLGQGLRRWLDSPQRLRTFNWVMAALLVASLWPVLATD